MSFPDLIVLLILPGFMWASVVYVNGSTSKIASRLRAARSAKTKKELTDGAQSWTLFGLLIFCVVLACVLAWARVHAPSTTEKILNPSYLGRGIFHGIILGLALVGLVLIFRHYFPQARKFGFLVMAGIASPPLLRIFVLLLAAFTEELWRAVSLKALILDGFSGPQALIATSLAYGLAYLAWGPAVAISDGIIGAVYGGLFVWSGSLFVPFAAHITLR